MSLSQFFILSPRGDTIIVNDFRRDLPKGLNEIFFRQVKFFQGKQQQHQTTHDTQAPPVFHLNGVNYIYVKKNGLYFVGISKQNVSPVLIIELLTRFTKVFKDYCGILSEESIRKNFVLIYELVTEMMDFGCPQTTSTENLKAFVFNEPIAVKKEHLLESLKLPEMYQKTTPSTSVDKPIALSSSSSHNGNRKNEVFVDIYERISVTLNSNGNVLNSEVDGTIQMKSYLSGNPELKLALSEELVVGRSNNTGSGGYGVVCLDDCNFHESVRLDDFEHNRVLILVPPDGEFAVMNYRIEGEFRVPFTIFPFFELVTPYRIELIIKIRADIPSPNFGGNVYIQIPVPRETTNVACELGVDHVGQNVEHTSDKKIIWRIKKFPGGSEQTLRCKITLGSAHNSSVRKEIGPVSMNFEIPMYNVSNLQVRYLRIMETHRSYNPFRWVRYVTKSNSYICRL